MELISFAEPLGKDDSGDMVRKFVGIVNVMQPKETSCATTRTMKENARRGTGTVHEILTRAAYTGIRLFNEFGRDSERKAYSEIIEYEVPVIVERSMFDSMQAHLVAQQPCARGTRLASAPSLLGGLVRCDCTMCFDHGDGHLTERDDIHRLPPSRQAPSMVPARH